MSEDFWKEQKGFWFFVKLLFLGTCYGKSYANNRSGSQGESKYENTRTIKYKGQWYCITISQVK